MKIFSFHLLETNPATTLAAVAFSPPQNKTSGLKHAECLSAMTLGAPIISPERLQLRKLAMFAYWEDEDALEAFLSKTRLGQKLNAGWHVRLQFLRQWGQFAGFDNLPEGVSDTDTNKPIVAVTLARLKLPEVFRFIRWGRPVEELVRDDPNTTLAMAAIRPLQTFSNFSIWRSQEAMTNMVRGRSNCPRASRHADAMVERARRDFHHQFMTFRFRAVSEHGSWQGNSHFIPDVVNG